MSKMVFKTWEEVEFSDGTKSWCCVGYDRRPHLPIVKETKASWFFVKPDGRRIKVSKTDKGRYDSETQCLV